MLSMRFAARELIGHTLGSENRTHDRDFRSLELPSESL